MKPLKREMLRSSSRALVYYTQYRAHLAAAGTMSIFRAGEKSEGDIVQFLFP